MSKKVENGPIGKLFRTLGFLLLLVSGVILVLNHANTFEFIETRIDVVNNIVYDDLSFLIEYTHLMLLVGLVLLVWTQSKSIVIKILLSLTSLAAFLTYYQLDQNILPASLRFSWLEISFILDKLNEINWLSFAVLGANSLFLYLLLGFKKPKRVSSQLVSSSMIMVLLGLLIYNLPVLLNQTIDITTLISSAVLGLGYLTMTLGSLFGVLGFARK